MTTIIQAQTVNSRQDEIPSAIFGIGDPNKGMIRRASLMNLKEEYDHEIASQNNHIINHAIKGKDFEDDLIRLHKNVVPFVPKGSTHNAEDNYIFDTLKKGKPDAATLSHVLTVMNQHNPGYHFNDSRDNSRYLKQKWEPLIKEHFSQPLKHTEPSDSDITHEELQNVPQILSPLNYRSFVHPSGHVFEYQKDRGLQYIGKHSGKLAMNLDMRGRADTEFMNKDQELSKHYGNYTNNAAYEYSKHSANLNSFLANPQKVDPDAPAHHQPEYMNAMSEAISHHINTIPHPTHTQSFHVYTGIHHLADPAKELPVNEFGEKLIKSPGFTSTSLSKNVAESFAMAKNEEGHPHKVSDILKIEIPGGYPHGAYIKPYSQHAHEHEYLLDKGHTFVIHPEPTYHVGSNEVHRVWEAKIHPKEYNESGENWHQLSTASKIGAALNHDAKPEILNKAANDPSEMVRAAAAKHPNIGSEDYKNLLSDQMSNVRQSAATNVKLPHNMIEKIIGSGDSALQKGLAHRKKLSEDIKSRLVDNEFPSVEREMAKRTDLSDEHIDKLLEGDRETSTILAANPSLKEHHFGKILEKGIPAATLAIAKNSSTPKPMLEHLMDHDDAEVRSSASNNPRRFRVDK